MKKQQETNNEQKYLKGSATEDICVSVSNNDKDVKSASLEVGDRYTNIFRCTAL